MRWLSLLSLLAVASGCDTSRPYACTLDFRAVSVTVVDSQGAPVEGLDAVSVVERTGEALERTSDPYDGNGGVYVVASDAHLDKLSIEGESVRFTATGEGLRATASFVLADDGCHIQKEEGPEEVTATAL